MPNLRFGRRLNLPSTAQIKHELRLMTAADALASSIREADSHLSITQLGAQIDDLVRANGISVVSRQMLIDRLCPKVEAKLSIKFE